MGRDDKYYSTTVRKQTVYKDARQSCVPGQQISQNHTPEMSLAVEKLGKEGPGSSRQNLIIREKGKRKGKRGGRQRI